MEFKLDLIINRFIILYCIYETMTITNYCINCHVCFKSLVSTQSRYKLEQKNALLCDSLWCCDQAIRRLLGPMKVKLQAYVKMGKSILECPVDNSDLDKEKTELDDLIHRFLDEHYSSRAL